MAGGVRVSLPVVYGSEIAECHEINVWRNHVLIRVRIPVHRQQYSSIVILPEPKVRKVGTIPEDRSINTTIQSSNAAVPAHIVLYYFWNPRHCMVGTIPDDCSYASNNIFQIISQ